MTRRLVGVLLLCVACSSGDSSAPSAGNLTLQFAGGTGNEGAVVVIVSGGPVSSVDSPAGYQVATNVDGSGTHIMVMGNLAAGVIATIAVPNPSLAAAYVVTVVQVADRTSFTLLDPARYQVIVGK